MLSATIHYHLLGQTSYEAVLALQRRLVYEAGADDGHRIVILFCEHPLQITIGRRGSRGDIRMDTDQLRRGQIPVQWVARGGGCLLHAPGQLAIYPIVRLTAQDLSVGEYLRRVHSGLIAALEELGVHCRAFPHSYGIWGRSGQLAACGVAVRHGTTMHGWFLNVNPTMTCFPLIRSCYQFSPGSHRDEFMGCLARERRRVLTMPKVRAALIPRLAASLETERYHILHGHPELKPAEEST